MKQLSDFQVTTNRDLAMLIRVVFSEGELSPEREDAVIRGEKYE